MTAPSRDIETLADIARVYAAQQPGAVAATFEGRVTSYGLFDQHTNKVAQALRASGVQKGDRIAYLGKNSDLYFELLFGATKVGAVCLPIGWRLAPTEIAYILKDSDTALLFAGGDLAELAKEAVTLTGREIELIDMDSPSADGFAAWRDSQTAEPLEIDIKASDVALQLYTSGTTGHPKGVELSHQNLLETWSKTVASDLDWAKWSPDDVGLVAMPVAHIAGTGFGIIALANGARNVILREFDPVQVLALMAPERISKVIMVPAALNFLIQMPTVRDIDYSHLNLVYYGASPIPLDLLKQCMEIFGCDFCQQYGMTETCGTVVYLPPEDHDAAGNQRMRSAGLPLPGVELKIVDSSGNRLPPNTVGEVATRSSSNMVGYWKNDAATRETVDDDGWLHTGDAGYLDDDGYLFIQDRLKDMIISGAENIYPAEVESALFGHPDIAEVAVIGVPDDTWGEAVKAVVALKPGAKADPDDILAFARARIAAFKVPKSVDFVPLLPRNASGKVLKRTLREPYWADKDRRVN